jgi:hypothetical protein
MFFGRIDSINKMVSASPTVKGERLSQSTANYTTKSNIAASRLSRRNPVHPVKKIVFYALIY